MIKFSRHILENGLTVLCNTDPGTPFVSVNILYKVGAKNESPQKTGFAHLFEHLMFSGSVHVKDFDRDHQRLYELLHHHSGRKSGNGALAGIRPDVGLKSFFSSFRCPKACSY